MYLHWQGMLIIEVWQTDKANHDASAVTMLPNVKSKHRLFVM
jgi:hypothetical protein